MNYYNENNPYCAQWLRNLIAGGVLPAGDVDERSIEEVKADDIKKYTQCHFFAGIGGWSYALQLAGITEDEQLWTGSCPCQPFSVAGKRKGKNDERHLWPKWFELIRECHPPIIFGEQVAGAITHGWLDDTADALESEDYAFGSSVLPASCVGAPHKRDRAWFFADSTRAATDGGDQNGRRQRRFEEMEKDRVASYTDQKQQRSAVQGRQPCDGEVEQIIANANQALRENGFMESRIRETEIALNRCAFLEAWQGWNGGFSGFGRMDDGVSPRMAKSVVGGFGNAIVPKLAAEFIQAAFDARRSAITASKLASLL